MKTLAGGYTAQFPPQARMHDACMVVWVVHGLICVVLSVHTLDSCLSVVCRRIGTSVGVVSICRVGQIPISVSVSSLPCLCEALS